jgi:hypothetical protein
MKVIHEPDMKEVKPVKQIVLETLSQKTKQASRVAQGVGAEFKH